MRSPPQSPFFFSFPHGALSQNPFRGERKGGNEKGGEKKISARPSFLRVISSVGKRLSSLAFSPLQHLRTGDLFITPCRLNLTWLWSVGLGLGCASLSRRPPSPLPSLLSRPCPTPFRSLSTLLFLTMAFFSTEIFSEMF